MLQRALTDTNADTVAPESAEQAADELAQLSVTAWQHLTTPRSHEFGVVINDDEWGPVDPKVFYAIQIQASVLVRVYTCSLHCKG